MLKNKTKIIALSKVYNESWLIEKSLHWYYPLVDQLVISEGKTTPFGNLPKFSIDGTREKIEQFISKYDYQNKIILVDAFEGSNSSRSIAGGHNQNMLLSHANIKDGDIIFILDCDEFFGINGFNLHTNIMKTSSSINFIKSQEWQFAYNMKLAFKSSHGRFMRYTTGSKFTKVNNLVYSNGVIVKNNPDMVIKLDVAEFYHLSCAKHPLNIREKIISFNLPYLTQWYNEVYLIWPIDAEQAYKNNQELSKSKGWIGTGFGCGLGNKLEVYTGTFPSILKDINIDWLEYIIKNNDLLKIKF